MLNIIFKNNKKRLTKYERAMKNRNKTEKRRLKKDIKVIKREINQMIKSGNTKSMIVYKANKELFEYIKDNKLFTDCKINKNKIVDDFIEIEFLNI